MAKAFTGVDAWVLYVAALLGVIVENPQEKFDALNESEQAAWEAVAKGK